MTDTNKEQGLQRIVAPRSFSLLPQSLGEAMEIAKKIADSDFAPKDYKGKPDNVMIAIQMGADLGLKPMQALQNIAVVNGRPSIYGDAALALVMPVLERFHEEFTGTFPNDDFTAHCVSKRKGWPDETRTTFSIADAKKANLWGKAGPWQNYPQRMLVWRSRGFNLRNVGADLLLGLVLVEEAGDYPAAIETTAIVTDVTVVPPKSVVIFEQLPEAVRDNIEKAFGLMNFADGARLAKINEYFGGDGIVPDEQAVALLDWLKDEFAKRKTGMPRARGNGKDSTKKADDKKEPEKKGETAGAEAKAEPPKEAAATVGTAQAGAPATTLKTTEEALF